MLCRKNERRKLDCARAFEISGANTKQEVIEQHQVLKAPKSHLCAQSPRGRGLCVRGSALCAGMAPPAALASLTPGLNYSTVGLLSNSSYLSY